MKVMKKLYFDLMIRFLFLILAVVIISIGFFVILEEQVDSYVEEHAISIIDESDFIIDYIPENKEFVYSPSLVNGYRYEILKDYEIIYSVGPEIGYEKSYTPEDINAIIQRIHHLRDKNSYMASYLPFTASNGEYYALIIKEPLTTEEGKARTGVNLPPQLIGTWVEDGISNIINRTFLIAVVLLMVIAFLVSRLTTVKIIKPLKSLRKGLNEVDNGNLAIELDFKANKEFEEVRDAFNRMTKRILLAEEENAKLQESKKQFILDLSHDLRTPITTIQGYAQALTSDMVSDELTKEKYLKYIYSKSNTMTKLINKLFDYSKLESSNHQLKKELHDLANCYRNVIINHLDLLEEKEFLVDIEIPEDRVDFICDQTEMERAIGNIIGNQIKYNPQNTKVTYKLEEVNSQVILSLEDDGIGIEPEVLDKIFDVMVRGDESRHGMDGTGLGLAITKRVVELHGGTIEVESEIGKGTVFTIKLKR